MRRDVAPLSDLITSSGRFRWKRPRILVTLFRDGCHTGVSPAIRTVAAAVNNVCGAFMSRCGKMFLFSFVFAVLLSNSAEAKPGKILRMPDKVAGDYIVTVSREATPLTVGKAAEIVGGQNRVMHVVSTQDTFLILARMADAAALQVTHHPLVLQVEEVAKLQLSQASNGNTLYPADMFWHLRRVEQRGGINAAPTGELPNGGMFTPTRMTGGSALSTTRVYVIDTGVWPGHAQFTPGQVLPGINFAGDGTGTGSYSFSGRSWRSGDDPTGASAYGSARYLEEDAGHGTSVASVVAGGPFVGRNEEGDPTPAISFPGSGILPGVTIVPVKVFDHNADGTTDMLGLGLAWVIEQQRLQPEIRMVINMSLSFRLPTTPEGELSAIDRLVADAVEKGIVVVAAANNFGTPSDACNYSPARAPRAITVGATKRAGGTTGTYDEIWAGSNVGPCVDIFAPGHNMAVADISADNLPGWNTVGNSDDPNEFPLATQSAIAFRNKWQSVGTSFASPLVAGLAAYYLSHHKDASPATVWDYLRMNATTATNNNNVDPVTGTPSITPTPRVLAYSHFAVATDLSPSLKSDIDADGAVAFKLRGANLPTASVTLGATAATLTGTLTSPPGIIFEKSSTQSLSATSLSAISLSNATGDVTALFPRGFLVQPVDVMIDPTPTNVPNYAIGEVTAGMFDHLKIFMRSRISAGCGGGKFCPGSPVSRAQMAVFLLAAEHGPGYVPPAATGAVFWDVPANSFAAAWIEQLAREGITGGCGAPDPNHDGLPPFCPGSSVTRQQMAVFILAALLGTTYTPPAMSDPPLFSDVPFATTGSGPWIEDLYRRGITGGCAENPLKYCPASSLTRIQMAVFLNTAFKLQCGETNGCASDDEGKPSGYPVTVDGEY